MGYPAEALKSLEKYLTPAFAIYGKEETLLPSGEMISVFINQIKVPSMVSITMKKLRIVVSLLNPDSPAFNTSF